MEKEMFKAVKEGRADEVARLLGKQPELVRATDRDGSTPLHWAAWKGHAEIARLLIAHSADVNAQNTNGHWGTTPLHAAAHADNAEVVAVLADAGARIDAADMNGKTPLDHTTFHNARRAAKALAALAATQ